MAKNLKYDEFFVVYRNTWKNKSGNIRTQVYASAERAEDSARCSPSNMFQEIAQPVHTSQCLIPGG